MTKESKDVVQLYKDFIHSLLIPDESIDSIFDIPFVDLYAKSYRTMFLDVDNTLVKRGEKLVSLQVKDWILHVKNSGFKVFAVSNNTSGYYIQKICSQLSISGVYFAMKPLTTGLHSLSRRYEIDLKKSIFVGDQVLTDVCVGNLVGARTILVEPVNKKSSMFKLLQYKLERQLLKKVLRW